ncbi:MAG: hypothetical protein JJU27_19190 [Gammaproteobacteria bacterium]|nr:hypothetical protein [Phycisphaeraceae bacterium]MCC5870629.1 hypothetical protein [Gammaproteobacteria bacterium]
MTWPVPANCVLVVDMDAIVNYLAVSVITLGFVLSYAMRTLDWKEGAGWRFARVIILLICALVFAINGIIFFR